MENNLIRWNKLETEFSNAKFVLETQQQIAKDFGTCGIDFPNNFLVHSLSTHLILEEIQFALKKIHSIEELLYRIDVPEEFFVHSIDLKTLSEIILKREAYKVWLRSKF